MWRMNGELGVRKRCLTLPVPHAGFLRFQEGGALAHFSGISLGTVMVPV